jgi:Amiloride-sensitive sodium channel
LNNLNLTEIYEFMMHDCEKFLVKCTWRRKPFDCCKYFSKQKSEYGICWSFNSFSNEGTNYVNRTQNFPWRISNKGRHSGLEVMMNVNPEFVVERKNNELGILAIIHHPHEHPNSAQFIAAKSITSLIIKPTTFSTSDDVKRLSPIDRQCYYDVGLVVIA